MRAAHGHRRGRGPLLLAAAVGAALLFVALRRPSGSAELPQLPQSFLDGVALATSPWPKLQNISDLEVLWELPPSPQGVLFVAHGCSHSGSDFWPKSGRCMHCLALPEEMRVRQAALARGYAVVAVSSYNRETMCWHNTGADKSEDLKRVPGILKQVIAEAGLGQLPLYAFGASSGGGFVLRLAQAMPEVQGVVCQINPVNPAAFEVPAKRRYPPTIFVHMAQRDPEKAATVTQAMAILKKAKTPAAEIRIAPQPVTPAFLQRAVQINETVAEAVVAALREGGFLDEEGQLRKDPRSTLPQWQPLLRPVVGGLNLEPDVSPLAELLNVAYARHEIVSDTTDVTLEWLEAGGAKADLPGVLQAREANSARSFVRYWRLMALALLTIALAVVAQLAAGAGGAVQAPALPPLPGSASAPQPPPDEPWPKWRNMSDLETLWELPPSPTGVLFLAHGCNHAAADFWPPSERCPHCTGLPQERLVRQAALARGYAVIAISSLNRETQCWHNTGADKSEDVQRVPGILKQVTAEAGLGQLPLYAFGASSGGGFVLRLAQAMPEVQGIVAQIVPARPALMRRKGGQPFPPTLFVHMAEREPEWAAQIEETLRYCRAKGIPAAEIQISPQPVTPDLLLTSVRLNRSTAEAAVTALAAGGFLDAGGYLREDPREAQAAWQAALLPVLDSQDVAGAARDVAQLLNVAYAQHELTGSSTGAALAWLEAGGAANIDELLLQSPQEHDVGQSL